MSTAKIDPEAEMEAAFLRLLAKQLGVDELSEEALAKSLGFDSLTDEKLDEWFVAMVVRRAREPSERVVQTDPTRAQPVSSRVLLPPPRAHDDDREVRPARSTEMERWRLSEHAWWFEGVWSAISRHAHHTQQGSAPSSTDYLLEYALEAGPPTATKHQSIAVAATM